MKFSEMFGRGIAPMAGKSILRIFPVEFVHDSVPGDLGQNTCGGNAQAEPVPSYEGGMFDREPLHGHTIHKSMGTLMSIFMNTC